MRQHLSAEIQEANRRRNLIETYTEPIATTDPNNANDVSEFMLDFNKSVEQYEVDFAGALKQYPVTLAKHYQNLVPSQVPHKAFIQRYFYRCCDDSRIRNDLKNIRNITTSSTTVTNATTATVAKDQGTVTTIDTQTASSINPSSSSSSNPQSALRKVGFKGVVTSASTANNSTRNGDESQNTFNQRHDPIVRSDSGGGGGVRFRQKEDTDKRAAWESEELDVSDAIVVPPAPFERQKTLSLAEQKKRLEAANPSTCSTKPSKPQSALRKTGFRPTSAPTTNISTGNRDESQNIPNQRHDQLTTSSHGVRFRQKEDSDQRAAWESEELDVSDSIVVPPTPYQRQVTLSPEEQKKRLDTSPHEDLKPSLKQTSSFNGKVQTGTDENNNGTNIIGSSTGHSSSGDLDDCRQRTSVTKLTHKFNAALPSRRASVFTNISLSELDDDDDDDDEQEDIPAPSGGGSDLLNNPTSRGKLKQPDRSTSDPTGSLLSENKEKTATNGRNDIHRVPMPPKMPRSSSFSKWNPNKTATASSFIPTVNMQHGKHDRKDGMVTEKRPSWIKKSENDDLKPAVGDSTLDGSHVPVYGKQTIQSQQRPDCTRQQPNLETVEAINQRDDRIVDQNSQQAVSAWKHALSKKGSQRRLSSLLVEETSSTPQNGENVEVTMTTDSNPKQEEFPVDGAEGPRNIVNRAQPAWKNIVLRNSQRHLSCRDETETKEEGLPDASGALLSRLPSQERTESINSQTQETKLDDMPLMPSRKASLVKSSIMALNGENLQALQHDEKEDVNLTARVKRPSGDGETALQSPKENTAVSTDQLMMPSRKASLVTTSWIKSPDVESSQARQHDEKKDVNVNLSAHIKGDSGDGETPVEAPKENTVISTDQPMMPSRKASLIASWIKPSDGESSPAQQYDESEQGNLAAHIKKAGGAGKSPLETSKENAIIATQPVPLLVRKQSWNEATTPWQKQDIEDEEKQANNPSTLVRNYHPVHDGPTQEVRKETAATTSEPTSIPVRTQPWKKATVPSQKGTETTAKETINSVIPIRNNVVCDDVPIEESKRETVARPTGPTPGLLVRMESWKKATSPWKKFDTGDEEKERIDKSMPAAIPDEIIPSSAGPPNQSKWISSKQRCSSPPPISQVGIQSCRPSLVSEVTVDSLKNGLGKSDFTTESSEVITMDEGKATASSEKLEIPHDRVLGRMNIWRGQKNHPHKVDAREDVIAAEAPTSQLESGRSPNRSFQGNTSTKDKIKKWAAVRSSSARAVNEQYPSRHNYSSKSLRTMSTNSSDEPYDPNHLAQMSVAKAERRRNSSKTYTDVLALATLSEADDADEFSQFMMGFSCEKYNDDIQIALAKYPDTVAVQFKKLVPSIVTRDEFWFRYFYRSDEKRILRTLRRSQSNGMEAAKSNLASKNAAGPVREVPKTNFNDQRTNRRPKEVSATLARPSSEATPVLNLPPDPDGGLEGMELTLDIGNAMHSQEEEFSPLNSPMMEANRQWKMEGSGNPVAIPPFDDGLEAPNEKAMNPPWKRTEGGIPKPTNTTKKPTALATPGRSAKDRMKKWGYASAPLEDVIASSGFMTETKPPLAPTGLSPQKPPIQTLRKSVNSIDMGNWRM